MSLFYILIVFKIYSLYRTILVEFIKQALRNPIVLQVHRDYSNTRHQGLPYRLRSKNDLYIDPPIRGSKVVLLPLCFTSFLFNGGLPSISIVPRESAK